MIDMFADTVAAFGRRLGLASLAPDASGVVELGIETVGRLQLEADGDFALVTLARARAPHRKGAAFAALALCHWRETHPWTVHAGMKDGEWLLFAARVPLAEFDVPALDQALGYLSGLLDMAEKAD